nr:phospholipase-like protein [Tanacetum cinerariifolium]
MLYDHDPILIDYMLRRQHKVDDQHHDMPFIYYMEGHKLHFSRREFSLITSFCFGTVSFDLHISSELKFWNKVFPNKIGFSITNLDIIGVIEDEEIFGKLSNDDAICLCLLLALEIRILETFERCESWWIKEPKVIPRALGWSKKSLFTRSDYPYLFSKVLSHERSDIQAKLKFTDEFLSMTSKLCDSLNSMFADLIEPADPDEDIAQDTSRVLQSMDIVWLSDDIKRFLGQSWQIKCKFPWNDGYIVDRNFWLKLEESHSFLSLNEQHIDLWVDYMWHVRPENSNWAMVSCYFVQLLLQNGMPLFYANGERLAHGFSLDVDDPVDIALAYREKMNPSTSFMDNSKRYAYGKVLPLKLSNSNWMTYSELLDMLVYNLECEIRALFYSIPRNSLETGFTIVEFDYTITHTTSMKIDSNADVAFTEVILGTDDETSSNDDTYSNDEISSSEDLINYLSARDVECVLGSIGKAHYGLRSLGPLKEEMVHNQKTHFGTITKEQRYPTFNYHLLMKQNKRMLFFGVLRSDLDEFLAGNEMFLEINEVVFKIRTKGYFEYDPLRYVNGSVHCVSSFARDKDVFQQCLNHIISEIDEPKWALFYCKPKKSIEKGLKLLHTDNDVHSFIDAAVKNGSTNLYVDHKKQKLGKYYYKNMECEEDDAGLRCSSSTPFSTRVKTKISKRKKTSMIHDEGDDRKKSLITKGHKGNEKVIEDEGICRKGNKADVTIYKRAMVNGKAKMVEDVDAMKRGKERGVVIEDGSFSNDGGKETLVTKRVTGSREIEGKSVKLESE